MKTVCVQANDGAAEIFTVSDKEWDKIFSQITDPTKTKFITINPLMDGKPTDNYYCYNVRHIRCVRLITE